MREYFIWLFKLLTLVAIFCFVVPLLFVVVGKATQTAVSDTIGLDKNMVAVVELKDMIASSKETLEELYKQAKNTKVKGIVLRIDSPGGAVGPSQDIYEAVKKLKQTKPIVASMGALAASGGLYAALGASKIYCQPGTITGSIGVILQIPNIRRVAEMVGVEVVTVKSGDLKDVGNSFRDMTPYEREFLQTTVHTAYEQFVAAVAEGRGLEVEKVRQFADGRIILGTDAKKLGLIDEFGDVYDAARAVFEISGAPLPPGEYPKLHYPSDKYGQIKKLLEGLARIPSILQPGFELQYVAR